MGLFRKLPPNIKLLPAAAKDLERLLKKDPINFRRIFEDIVRLSQGTLPPQGRKRLRNIDAFQFDCGRFRIVYALRKSSFVILAVFTKSAQKKHFKSL